MTLPGEYAPGRSVGGRYAIEEAIGRGGYATVYRARRLDEGGEVALKVMHRHPKMEEVDVLRFEREASLAGRLHHRNVVAQLDHGRTDDDRPFIVFELLRGCSLEAHIDAHGPLDGERLGRTALQALRALEAAHALSIVHRDIKPSNLFLCGDHRSPDHVRVIDFGIAKALADDETGVQRITARGQLLGTPAYMSPEQVGGAPIGLACDLYSLGLVMAEALTGQRVVDQASDAQSLSCHLARAEHDLGPDVMASPYGAVIARAVRKRPEDRYPSAEAMLHDVHAALEHSAPAARAM